MAEYSELHDQFNVEHDYGSITIQNTKKRFSIHVSDWCTGEISEFTSLIQVWDRFTTAEVSFYLEKAELTQLRDFLNKIIDPENK